MNWKVGNRAVLYARNPLAIHAYLVGTQCTIISLTSTHPDQYSVIADEAPIEDPRGWRVHPRYLRPIYEPPEIGSWEDSVWKPKELERIK